jgi:hypothetical protein
MVDEVATKGAVLFARRREDGNEPTVVLHDVGHVLPGRQLGVGYIEEVESAQQLDQGVPGSDVGRRVLHVPVRGPTGNGHRPVSGHRENEHELLQVRPVVLGVSPLGRHRRLGSRVTPVALA